MDELLKRVLISIIWDSFHGGESLSYDFFFSVTDGQNANPELITLLLVLTCLHKALLLMINPLVRTWLPLRNVIRNVTRNITGTNPIHGYELPSQYQEH